MKPHNTSDGLARLIVTACQGEAIKVRAFSIQDYALLPAFNWDVRSHEESAAIHLIDEDVSILHAVSVLEKGSLVYRAKTLVSSPPSILELRDDDGDAFSVSFVDDAGASWKSDCESGLGKVIAKALSRDSTLKGLLLSFGHSNVNAWLEGFDPVSYMAVNTGKRYSSAKESVDFIKVSNEIAKRIQAFPGF